MNSRGDLELDLDQARSLCVFACHGLVDPLDPTTQFQIIEKGIWGYFLDKIDNFYRISP